MRGVYAVKVVGTVGSFFPGVVFEGGGGGLVGERRSWKRRKNIGKAGGCRGGCDWGMRGRALLVHLAGRRF